MTATLSLAPLLQRFFTDRLMQQRRVSPHTISSYRDTFRQFLKFTQQRVHRQPSVLQFEDIDAPLVVAFLGDLEKRRGLSVRSRNLRLTAIHSFFRYLAFELPTHAAQIQRVLAIPANASHAGSSASSRVRKSMLCSPLRIVAPGSAGAITRLS
jgi:site-specific recombinase XerD